jgi:hypothetical protein
MSELEYIKQIDNFPLSKAVVLPNGYVRFVAPIARATPEGSKGFLNISQKDGKLYYQKVSKELLEKTKGSFANLPVTKGHPKHFLNSSNTAQYVKGFSGSSRDSVIQVDNYQFATGTIFDEDLITAIKNRSFNQISPGYKTNLSTLQNDECDQLSRIGNHLAFVSHGRNGSTVALQLDESDIPWDSLLSEQYDEAAIADIAREITGLPESFLDLSFSTEVINLDSVKIQQKDERVMPKLQLVTDQSTIVALESDQCDEIASYIDRLKKKNDDATIAMSTMVSKDQVDAAVAELEKLKAQKPETTEQIDEAAIQSTAQKMALDFVKVVPNILKLNPQHQFDSVPSLPELHRAFLVLACPARKDEFMSMQLDKSPEGIRNAARLEGNYEVLSTQGVTTQQTDSAQNSQFSSALQSILQHSAVVVSPEQNYQQQTDSAQKSFVSEVDARF